MTDSACPPLTLFELLRAVGPTTEMTVSTNRRDVLFRIHWSDMGVQESRIPLGTTSRLPHLAVRAVLGDIFRSDDLASPAQSMDSIPGDLSLRKLCSGLLGSQKLIFESVLRRGQVTFHLEDEITGLCNEEPKTFPFGEVIPDPTGDVVDTMQRIAASLTEHPWAN